MNTSYYYTVVSHGYRRSSSLSARLLSLYSWVVVALGACNLATLNYPS